MTDVAFRHFRPRRLRFFYDTFGVTAQTRIVDLGGMPYFWLLAQELELPLPQITIVNLLPPPDDLPPQITWIQADATRTPLPDQSFDIVFCNSLIEHLHFYEAQQLLAAEIQRLAPRAFVQTPSRRFPIEQHLWAIGVHWAPRRWQPWLMHRTSLAGWFAKFDREKCEGFARELCLLDRTQLAGLFPEAQLLVERFLGLEKSIIAILETGESKIAKI